MSSRQANTNGTPELREVAEEFCEIYQIPGRTEVDELARAIHELRREVRALKRQAASNSSSRSDT